MRNVHLPYPDSGITGVQRTLAPPTIVVRYLYRREPTRKAVQRIHSWHYGVTSAVKSAARLRRGDDPALTSPRPAWIEGRDRATLPTPSKSPAVRARLRSRA